MKKINKYNLKKTKITEAETLTHCFTVIDIMLEESHQAFDNRDTNLSARKWKEAELYLKNYIKELFKQQI